MGNLVSKTIWAGPNRGLRLRADAKWFGMDCCFRRLSVIQTILGSPHFLRSCMDDQKELAGLQVPLVFQDIALRNANADQCCAEGTEPAYHDGVFQRAGGAGQRFGVRVLQA